MEDDTGHVGRRLREIRAWRGLTLRECAELAGLSEGHLSRVERASGRWSGGVRWRRSPRRCGSRRPS